MGDPLADARIVLSDHRRLCTVEMDGDGMIVVGFDLDIRSALVALVGEAERLRAELLKPVADVAAAAIQCAWQIAWVGRCKDVAIGGPCCPKHSGKACTVCGKPAIGDCSQTMGPLVCGAPLCRDHVHISGEDFRHGTRAERDAHYRAEVVDA